MFRVADFRAERILLVVLAVVPLGLNLALTFLRVEPAWPLTPWEPAMLVEGWRFAHGANLFDASGEGHATHLYGPLFTVLLAGLQSLFGFNYPAIRLFFALIGVMTSLGLAYALVPFIQSWQFLLTATLFLSVSLQTGLSFPLSWADMPALLCAVFGLILLLNSRDPLGFGRGLWGGGLIVVAFLFKQTAAMASVAAMVLWIFSPSLRQRCGWWLCLPLVLTLATVGLMAAVFPAVFHQIVVVPSAIEIQGERVWDGLAYVLRGHPLVWACLGLMVAGAAKAGAMQNRKAWAIVGLVVVTLSVWTFAKAGGYYNSLLPGFLMLSIFSVAILRAVSDEQIRGWAMVGKAGLGLAFLVTTTVGGLEAARLVEMRHGDASYQQAIWIARELRGAVVCPEDPSIPLQSTGVPGRSIFLELDFASRAGRWPRETPARVAVDLQRADWLIRVRGNYAAMNDSRLPAGPEWVEVGMPGLENSVYSFWRRAKLDDAPTSSP